MFHNGSLWSTLTGDTMPCEWQVTGPYPAPDHWGSEHCDITTPNGQTHIDAWQALHT